MNSNAPTSPPHPLAGLASLSDYEARARQCLPPAIWAYLNAGAADGLTHERNTIAFQALELMPRVLRSMAGGHTRVELLGCQFEHPILIAPTAYHRLAHPDGERATALAASAMKAGLVVSTLASMELEDIADGDTPCPLWFQLYLQPDPAVTLDLLRRAEDAGYRAVVVTADAPLQGPRNEDQRHGFALPPGVQAASLARYAGRCAAPFEVAAGSSLFQHPMVNSMATWESLAWLASRTSLPMLVKGLLHPADVEPALAAGAAGIIVSNHGGRVLDTAPASLEMLPAIVEASAGRVPVLMDGGVRRGTDVLKALALGARAVLVGRPILHGLAVAGATGVAHVLHLLRTELEMAMVLCGLRRLSDIDAAVLRKPPQP